MWILENFWWKWWFSNFYRRMLGAEVDITHLVAHWRAYAPAPWVSPLFGGHICHAHKILVIEFYWSFQNFLWVIKNFHLRSRNINFKIWKGLQLKLKNWQISGGAKLTPPWMNGNFFKKNLTLLLSRITKVA